MRGAPNFPESDSEGFCFSEFLAAGSEPTDPPQIRGGHRRLKKGQP